jgi:predicted secreted protein
VRWYTWETSQDISILKQVGSVEQTPSSSKMGAPGQIVLKFQAVQAGQGKLILVYHRPFEKDVPPAKTFSVDVTVQ